MQMVMYHTSQMAVAVLRKDVGGDDEAEGEETPEQKAMLDKMEAELEEKRVALAEPSYDFPPVPPADMPVIVGEANAWGVCEPCSMKTAVLINDWLRVHDKCGWHCHIAKLVVTEHNHAVQQYILWPPASKRSLLSFPINRSLYICYATILPIPL
jgi:hypothetical protein